METINPMVVTDRTTDTKYTLDFSRESVKFAEMQGFVVSNISKFPTTTVPKLWYLAFRKNHKSLSEDQTNKLFKKLFPDGIPFQYVTRLLELYNQAATSGVILMTDEDEDNEGKNPDVAVEL